MQLQTNIFLYQLELYPITTPKTPNYAEEISQLMAIDSSTAYDVSYAVLEKASMRFQFFFLVRIYEVSYAVLESRALSSPI